MKKYYLFKMDETTINFIPFVLLILMGVITGFVYPSILEYIRSISISKCFDFILLFVLYCMLHEFFHSLAYMIHRIPFNKIIYGIAAEKGVFYCLCKTNINRNMILRALFYPLVFLGIVTGVLAIIFNLPMLYLLSILNICGCSGDIIMFIYMIKLDKNIKFSEMDDPISFAIYSDKDVSKVKHFGLKYLGAKDDIKREDLKKIKISKLSYIVLAILVLLAVII